jgi:hypothetical protein
MGQSKLLFLDVRLVAHEPQLFDKNVYLPLSSGNGLSFLSNRKAQRSTSGIGRLGNFDADGMVVGGRVCERDSMIQGGCTAKQR